MSTLKEKLAAARAKVQAATPPTPTFEPEPHVINAVTKEPAKELTALEKLRLRAAEKASTQTSPAIIDKPVEKKEERMPTVITAANLAAKGVVNDEKSANKSSDAGIDIGFIRQKIAELENYDGGQLKGAMDNLSEMIMANPAACATMLPQDIGSMVKQLYRMTNNRVAMEMSTARAKPKKESDKITAADIAEALEGDWS